jgi:hypothetical protein
MKSSSVAWAASLGIVIAVVAAGPASATSDRPASSFYTSQGLKADGLRWQAAARTYQRLADKSGTGRTGSGRAIGNVKHTDLRVAPALISRPGDFDWGDAGIGAAGGLGLAGCAAVLVLLVRQARRHKLADSYAENAMFETYRMLGREREAELQREADRLHALPPARLWGRMKAGLSPPRRRAARAASENAANPGTTVEVEEPALPLTETP